MTRALVVNLASPELDRLAIELAARQSLGAVVRRYVNQHRWWERALSSLPGLRFVYETTLGRRLPPRGLEGARILEAGVLADFACAVVNRAGRRLPDMVMPMSRRLLARTERSIARKGAGHAHRSEVVVASYHVALPVFTRARAAGKRTVLNYPIAHHRWQYRYYAELARQQPGFAAALPSFGNVQAHGSLLDQEIDLADVILVGSEFARDTFVSEGIDPGRLRIIPYGVDTGLFRTRDSPPGQGRPFRIVFAGQIGERKGVSHLLQAYAGFRKPDTELHLVGDYVRGAEVYRQWRDLYRQTPNVPQHQLADIFRSADVFVFPTLVEGLGMVVLEAMACGLPVIATPNGPGQVIRDGVDGYIVPPRDSDALVARLQTLYDDADLCRWLGANARQRAEYWSWERYARQASDTVLQVARRAA